jgi:hypothetical protein
MEALLPALEKAHDKDDRTTAVADAILSAAAEGTNIVDRDRRAMDGFVFVDVENTELGVTETVQVFDAKTAVAEERAAERAAARESAPKSKRTRTRARKSTPPAAKVEDADTALKAAAATDQE